MGFIRVVRDKAIADALNEAEATQWALDTPTARHWHKVFVWIENAKFGRGSHWLEQREQATAEVNTSQPWHGNPALL